MINEFFVNPRGFVAPSLVAGHTTTVREFYERCIAGVLSDECIAAACYWHRMLVDYLNQPGAVLPLRLWENLGRGTDVNGLGNGSRRRALSVCPDKFSYVFASNSFARAIYSMVLSNIRPSVGEFLEMMRTFQLRIGFHWGNASADESLIAAYPIAYSRRFYMDGWYLAHIHGVGDEPYIGHEDIDIGQAFPPGNVGDWHREQLWGQEVPVRKLHANLNDPRKEVARALCLRFIDPLNYFLVPGQKYECHSPRTDNRIGEEPCIRDYMGLKMRVLVRECQCKDVRGDEYDDFCKHSLVDVTRQFDIREVGDRKINVKFGWRVDGRITRGGVDRANAVVVADGQYGDDRNYPDSGMVLAVTYGEITMHFDSMIDVVHWIVNRYVVDNPDAGIERIRATFRPQRMFKALADAQRGANWQRHYPREPIACANNEQLVVNRNWYNKPNGNWPLFLASAGAAGFIIRGGR